MKKLFKKVALMVMALFTLSVATGTVREVRAADYVETTFGEGKLLITTTYEGKTYYLPAETTSSAPSAIVFTSVSEISEDNLWTVTAVESNYYIKNKDGNFLYTTSANNGVRVGTTEGTWFYGDDNSLKFSNTGRFLGIYNAQDWRSYNTVSADNYKGSSTVLKFYKINAAAPSVTISGDSYTEEGKNVTLSANLSNVEGTIMWESSDTSVATIDSNGLITAKSMGTTTITATVNGTQGTLEFKVYPVEKTLLSISKALQVCELTNTSNSPYVYSTIGIINEINYEYNSDNDCISVTISDGSDSIYLYKMAGGSDLDLNSKITVTGYLTTYNGKAEFIEGSTYEIVQDSNENLPVILSSLNSVNSYMSLAYSYKATVTTETVPVVSSISDKLTRDNTGVTNGSSSYKDWTFTNTNSNVTYVGQSAGGNDSIQIRSKNSNSGIITTSSCGIFSKITVELATSSTRQLEIYGSNTAYTAVTDLYDDSTKGTLLGTLDLSTTTSLSNITDEYKYIGIRSTDGAIYLSSIEIDWSVEVTGEPETKEVTTLSESDFYIRCGVDTSLTTIEENVDSYGIRVSTGEKFVDYTITANSWGVETLTDPQYCYVVIALGDIINNKTRLTTEFTVCAYIEVDGIKYTSELTKTYSVVSMVEYYYEEKTMKEVEHLYNYFVEQKLIVEEAN